MKKITVLLILLGLFISSSAMSHCRENPESAVHVGGYDSGDGRVDTYRCPDGSYFEFVTYFGDNGEVLGFDVVDYDTGSVIFSQS